MYYYSDPTSQKALGNVNREFSRLEKKARKLKKLFEEGKISEKDLEKAGSEFKGIYKNVLFMVLNEKQG